MSSAKITLFTFARWKKQIGGDLFSQLSLPEGIDKDTLTENILLRGGEFEVVYSDPDFMEYSIGTWSRKWYRTMQKWIEALSIEYAPLENYDRSEYWEDVTDKDTSANGRVDSGNTRTHADTDTTTNNNTDTRTNNNTDTRTNNNTDKRTFDNKDETTIDSTVSDTIDEDDVRENQVSAFDSSAYQPSSKETLSHDGDNKREEDTTNTTEHTGDITDLHTGTIADAHTGTITDAHTGTITDAHTGTITDEYGEGHSDIGTEDVSFTHEGRIHGNIGVTTSQQMLQQELDIAEWNIYEHITDLFLTEFVIPIYS